MVGLLVLRVGDGEVVALGDLVENELVAVELTERCVEADAGNEGDDSEDSVVPNEKRVVGEGEESLAESVGEGWRGCRLAR